MARRKTSKRCQAKTILRLPDLEQSKVAVVHSLASLHESGMRQYVGKIAPVPSAVISTGVRAVQAARKFGGATRKLDLDYIAFAGDHLVQPRIHEESDEEPRD
jgi:hypothetical protein